MPYCVHVITKCLHECRWIRKPISQSRNKFSPRDAFLGPFAAPKALSFIRLEVCQGLSHASPLLPPHLRLALQSRNARQSAEERDVALAGYNVPERGCAEKSLANGLLPVGLGSRRERCAMRPRALAEISAPVRSSIKVVSRFPAGVDDNADGIYPSVQAFVR